LLSIQNKLNDAKEDLKLKSILKDPENKIDGMVSKISFIENFCSTVGKDITSAGSTQQVVGQPVIWNGQSCNLISPDFCVITSINGQAITNPDCCQSKGGYLGLDALGRTVCLKTNATAVNPNIVNVVDCPTTYSFNTLNLNTDVSNNYVYTEVLSFDGQSLSSDCCQLYSTNVDPSYYYDLISKKCVKKEILALKSCRFDLSETFISLTYPQYHFGSNIGIYSLEERMYIKVTKLEINGFDYISNGITQPQTILDSVITLPDKWNSVLFLQKTFNNLNINNYKAQLPGEPANISNTPDTKGLLTNIFNVGYGMYIIYPENDQFYIEFKVSTQSDLSNSYTIYYSNNGAGVLEMDTAKINHECGYEVMKTTSPMNETCYKIIDLQIGSEPGQCYPYVLGGNTYI
jgi:hypothetical protein